MVTAEKKYCDVYACPQQRSFCEKKKGFKKFIILRKSAKLKLKGRKSRNKEINICIQTYGGIFLPPTCQIHVYTCMST